MLGQNVKLNKSMTESHQTQKNSQELLVNHLIRLSLTDCFPGLTGSSTTTKSMQLLKLGIFTRVQIRIRTQSKLYDTLTHELP